jgi:hypothetical protein
MNGDLLQEQRDLGGASFRVVAQLALLGTREPPPFWYKEAIELTAKDYQKFLFEPSA